MKVLAINGSARKDGNTDILISRIFENLEAAGIETEKVEFYGQVIEPCKACFACGIPHFPQGFPLFGSTFFDFLRTICRIQVGNMTIF